MAHDEPHLTDLGTCGCECDECLGGDWDCLCRDCICGGSSEYEACP